MSIFIESEGITAFHPGYYLKEMIEDRGESEKDYAIKLGITPHKLGTLLQGDDSITEDIAKKIAKLLGGTEEYWLRLQTAFDEKKALLNV